MQLGDAALLIHSCITSVQLGVMGECLSSGLKRCSAIGRLPISEAPRVCSEEWRSVLSRLIARRAHFVAPENLPQSVDPPRCTGLSRSGAERAERFTSAVVHGYSPRQRKTRARHTRSFFPPLPFVSAFTIYRNLVCFSSGRLPTIYARPTFCEDSD